MGFWDRIRRLNISFSKVCLNFFRVRRREKEEKGDTLRTCKSTDLRTENGSRRGSELKRG